MVQSWVLFLVFLLMLTAYVIFKVLTANEKDNDEEEEDNDEEDILD